MGKRTTQLINAIKAAQKEANVIRDDYLKVKTKIDTAIAERDAADLAQQRYYNSQGYQTNLDNREQLMDADAQLQRLTKAFEDSLKEINALIKLKNKVFADWEAQKKVVTGLVDKLDAFIAQKSKDRLLPWDTKSMKTAREFIGLMRD
jgi:hypothetical protein